MQISPPIVETQMLIRKPVETVFQAFIDPAITTQFWFTKSSGKLVEGQEVVWEWGMYGASTKVLVQEILENQKITIYWDEPATTVEFNFQAISPNSTYVIIRNWGFSQTGDALIEALMNNTGGFTTVLDGLKAYLEHKLKLNLIGDKFLRAES